MPKFFVSNNQIKENIIKIIGNDVNHITNVLRLNINDEIIICNKDMGDNYITRIIEINKDKIICQMKEKLNKEELKVEITIFQGLPKADKMELIIQKCTELGVKEITPVSMERCVVKLDAKTEDKKVKRWQKIAEAASKQCRRNSICNINYVTNIKNICNVVKDYDIILVPYEEEQKTSFKEILHSYVNAKNLKIAIVIGPEGGFDKKEIDSLKENGAKIITLGKRILRTETVAIAMTSAIMYEFNELG